MGKRQLPTPPGRRWRGRRLWSVTVCLVLWLLILSAPTDAAPAPPDSSLYQQETEFRLVPVATSALTLVHAFVDAASVRAVVDGQVWVRDEDFRVRAKDGIWIPLQPLGKASGPDVLVVLSYRFQPFPVSSREDLHAVTTQPPAAAGEGGATALPAVALPEGGASLTVRGSKSVRVASGNRRELTVDQTLRLTIAGQLTSDIAVRASLSDDNLPVVPEGNTEELRDVDKVLVQLKAPHWEATLGDFVGERSGLVFGDYRRKLQGVSLYVRPGRLSGEVLAGAPRGVYRTVQLRGQEVNQGPYRLGSGEVGGDLFIVAGSERVTLDGERLGRGTDRDYVIDYVRGTITFTYRRLITAESEIVVEFEEGEGPYVRNVVGGGGEGKLRLPVAGGIESGFAVRLIREQDDPQRLRTGEITDLDQTILAAAGDDAGQAVAEGATQLAPGEGSYRQEDQAEGPIYVYDPEQGDYQVEFFYFGSGMGNYGVDSLTVSGQKVFSYRGEGSGSYRIGRPLPLPESHSLVSVTAHLGPAAAPFLRGEWNASAQDLNRLSALGDDNNDGTAWVVSGGTGERELGWRGHSLGRFDFSGWHENRDARFRPFLLQKDVFAYDRWGLGARARRADFLLERDAESHLQGSWGLGGERRSLKLAGQWGRLEHGATLAAERSSLEGSWRWLRGRGSSRWERATSRDRQDPLDVERHRLQHRVSWELVGMRPAGFYEEEQWEDAAVTSGAAAGSRWQRYGGSLGSLAESRWRWQTGWERGLADSLRAGTWRRERDSRTVRAEVATPAVAGMRMVGSGTWRRILSQDGPEQTTRLAKLDLTAKWEDWGSDWSLSYSVDNSRIEVLDRQVVFVGERQADYNEAGDFVGRNQGDFNVVLVGTDSLVATTAVITDLTWRQDFGFLGRDRPWGAWSTLTHLAVKGRSRTAEVGRLLALDPAVLFDVEDAVLGEVHLKQEVNLLRHLRWLDLRLRYDYDEARDRQYAAHPEDLLRRMYRGTATWSVSDRSSLRLRSDLADERRRTGEGSLGSRRSYEAITWQHEAEWALRPTPGNRLALAAEAIRRRDDVSGIRQREWALRPSVRYRLDERWSSQVELRWAEVESEEPAGAVRPFFFAFPGRNLEATARLGWEPSSELLVSLVYFGRRQGTREWQHDVRLESTARF